MLGLGRLVRGKLKEERRKWLSMSDMPSMNTGSFGCIMYPRVRGTGPALPGVVNRSAVEYERGLRHDGEVFWQPTTIFRETWSAYSISRQLTRTF